DDKGFVEHLWARRKVGYLLDQIRANGEKKELVDETVALAKKYGIATPYTSYLIVPDGPVPVANAAGSGGSSVKSQRLLRLGSSAPAPMGWSMPGRGLGGFGGATGGANSPHPGGAAAPATPKLIDYARAA